MTVSPTGPLAAADPSAPLQVYVVSHTHWDREWYHPAPRFRQRLMALVDALLGDPDGPFLLDGQAITLRDYLAVRPEADGQLRTALADGRLEAGPWYVLADNLIPSGEAIVRNLEAGRRVLQQFGAKAPQVAYCPDTFGHPAALPTIARGFGLPVAVVWRGAGGQRHPAQDLFRWVGPDGSDVLTQHLPPDGYEFGRALPADAARSGQRWGQLQRLWRERATVPVVLLLNGADHHARQPELQAALQALRAAAGPAASVRQSTLAAWAAAVQQVAPPTGLPAVHGELRDSYGYTWTLAGTYATRAHQKRTNARLERLLLRDVELWLALERLHAAGARPVANDGRITPAQLPALLHRTWEDLLATHPHDTICGCSVDLVADSLDVQQRLVADQARGVREAALQLVLQHDVVAARRDAATLEWRRLVVRNRAPRPRGGIARVRLLETLADVPVGPDSAPPPGRADSPWPDSPVRRQLASVVAQPLYEGTVHRRRESPQHYPDNDLVRQHHVLLWVPPVPASGLDVWDDARWTGPSEPPALPVRVQRHDTRTVIDNGRARLTVNRDDRAVALTVDDRTVPGLLSLLVQHDAGDTYTPSLRGPVERLACERARLVASGPLRAVVRLWWRTASPSRRPGDGGRIEVVTDLMLDAMSPVVQCAVRGRSWRTNHRLQLVWHTDVSGGTTWADAAFGPVRRDPIGAPAHAQETVPATMPLHRWAMHVSPLFGATMISDGLAEAEVADGRLALTLVRAVGELSRANLPERPGHAGWPVPTPHAQGVGRFAAHTALFLHGPMSDDVLARVRDVCDDVLLPLTGETWRDLQWTGRLRGVELSGEAFELSACTVSAVDDRAVIVRVVNNAPRAAWGTVRFPAAGPWEVTRCRLDETPVAPSVVVQGAFSFEGASREVLTIRVKRVPTASA